MASDPVPRDTKDWTWVLERPCPECGFDASAIAPEHVPELVRANSVAWLEVLATPGVDERWRPDVWSPLEYACHVRDVFELYDQRLGLMLTDDDPLFANWDQDEAAVAARYREQDPSRVAAGLQAAAERVATSFAAVEGEQWRRPGQRSDGKAFTVESFARYFVHDPVHHLHDVRRIEAT